MGTEAEATPTVLVPVVMVVVEVVEGRLLMSTLTLRESEDAPFPPPPPPVSEVLLLLAREGSSVGRTTFICPFSSALACISISLRSSRSL